jgi:hypothetical protein
MGMEITEMEITEIATIMAKHLSNNISKGMLYKFKYI